MFTGLVDHCGVITEVSDTAAGKTVWIETRFNDLIEGESIAIDGVCLTVTQPEQLIFRSDISPETLEVTCAQNFAKGQGVNLERALRLTDRIGGHFVTGDIDVTCRLSEKKNHDEFIMYRFAGLAAIDRQFLVKKGSIAINGVSLTLNRVYNDGFEVMLVPHTLERTNLGQLQIDDTVNIEYDYLAKIVLNREELFL